MENFFIHNKKNFFFFPDKINFKVLRELVKTFCKINTHNEIGVSINISLSYSYTIANTSLCLDTVTVEKHAYFVALILLLNMSLYYIN